MSGRKRITACFTVLLALAMAGAVVTLRRLDRMRAGAAVEEVLYIPSPRIVKALSLGYTGLVADLYWTRAVQYFGGKHYDKALSYKLLAPLLDITTTLDPHLLHAYQFGSVFLSQKPPEGAGEPDKAAELVERGIAANPKEWKLFFNLGFVHYLERNDPVAAAEAFERGSKVPDAHPWLRILAATMRQSAGDIATARALWMAIHETTNDEMIRTNAVKHLRALQVDEDVTNLEGLIAKYKATTGAMPASFLELVRAGWLRGIPVDPLGHPYKLVSGGKVEIEAPWALPFVNRGLPPEWQKKEAAP
jgi:hypothetical protein